MAVESLRRAHVGLHDTKGRNVPIDVILVEPNKDAFAKLKAFAGKKTLSSAVILESNEESVRYFLVYATNAFHGIEVFKQAEVAAARTQDYVRNETRITKARQPELMLEPEPPRSRLVVRLRERYCSRARRKVIEVLRKNKDPKGTRYEDLFCEAMAFPLVTPAITLEGYSSTDRVKMMREHRFNTLDRLLDTMSEVSHHDYIKGVYVAG